MFWGCISYFGVGTLAPVDKHIDSQKYEYIDILDENLWPVLCKYFGRKRWFQNDNASVHRYLLTRQQKTENNIPSITWPAQSPDISIIENTYRSRRRRLTWKASSITATKTLWNSSISHCAPNETLAWTAFSLHSSAAKNSFSYNQQRWYNGSITPGMHSGVTKPAQC